MTKWVKQQVLVHLGFAEPIEQSRRDISESGLQEWHEKVRLQFGSVDPHLVFNMDETGDEPRAAHQTRKVVTARSGKLTYKQDRPSK
jgi:uncharacterized protein YecE (DUF72 family)